MGGIPTGTRDVQGKFAQKSACGKDATNSIALKVSAPGIYREVGQLTGIQEKVGGPHIFHLFKVLRTHACPSPIIFPHLIFLPPTSTTSTDAIPFDKLPSRATHLQTTTTNILHPYAHIFVRFSRSTFSHATVNTSYPIPNIAEYQYLSIRYDDPIGE
jgi:hypothetical protein